MNEIDKLKTEHARYKKALADIQRGVYGREPSAIALEALHPVQRILPPVKLEDLKVALRKFNRGDGGFNHIMFYQDESGGIYNSYRHRIFSFNNLQEALDYLEATGL